MRWWKVNACARTTAQLARAGLPLLAGEGLVDLVDRLVNVHNGDCLRLVGMGRTASSGPEDAIRSIIGDSHRADERVSEPGPAGVGWIRPTKIRRCDLMERSSAPRPDVPAEKGARDRLIRPAERHPDSVLGFEDEVWWSRLARPELHAWAGDQPKRVHQPGAEAVGAGPKALACYGLLRADGGGMMIRFVNGRPVSQVTEDYLTWVCERLIKMGKRALLLVWDDASWHISQRVRSWIKEHNRRAKAKGRVRIVSCPLPVKAPWLNRIEPKWVHCKRAIVEPDRPLTAAEVVEPGLHLLRLRAIGTPRTTSPLKLHYVAHPSTALSPLRKSQP